MRKNGFSLLEVVFVLGIWSLLFLLAVPLQYSVLDNQEDEQFLKTFQSDILFLQNISYASSSRIELVFDHTNHCYTIEGLDEGTLLKRSFPAEWDIDERTMKEGISFNNHGTIRKPGRIQIDTPSTSYQIIFPLGKGRCYVEKL